MSMGMSAGMFNLANSIPGELARNLIAGSQQAMGGQGMQQASLNSEANVAMQQQATKAAAATMTGVGTKVDITV